MLELGVLILERFRALPTASQPADFEFAAQAPRGGRGQLRNGKALVALPTGEARCLDLKKVTDQELIDLMQVGLAIP